MELLKLSVGAQFQGCCRSGYGQRLTSPNLPETEREGVYEFTATFVDLT